MSDSDKPKEPIDITKIFARMSGQLLMENTILRGDVKIAARREKDMRMRFWSMSVICALIGLLIGMCVQHGGDMCQIPLLQVDGIAANAIDHLCADHTSPTGFIPTTLRPAGDGTMTIQPDNINADEIGHMSEDGTMTIQPGHTCEEALKVLTKSYVQQGQRLQIMESCTYSGHCP